MATDPRTWIGILRKSHERLASLVVPLTPEELRGPSYCSDWTVAQVLSHLGSGAAISLMMLPGALGQGEPLGRDAFQPVWDVWNAKTPDEQAADCLTSDAAHIRALEELSDDDLSRISFPFFGLNLDAVGLVRLRLGEHAVHTWDVAVSGDPDATISPDAVSLLIDNVPQFLAPRLGRPPQTPYRLRIQTASPDRDYLLIAQDPISLTDWPGDGTQSDGEVNLPAEALLRLAYGRLDPDHTPPSVKASPADLDRLRAIFPGF